MEWKGKSWNPTPSRKLKSIIDYMWIAKLFRLLKSSRIFFYQRLKFKRLLYKCKSKWAVGKTWHGYYFGGWYRNCCMAEENRLWRLINTGLKRSLIGNTLNGQNIMVQWFFQPRFRIPNLKQKIRVNKRANIRLLTRKCKKFQICCRWHMLCCKQVVEKWMILYNS